MPQSDPHRGGTPADRWPDDSPERGEANRIFREERFQLLVHGVTDYAIFLLDAEGRVICWNTGAERIFGYSESEVLDQFYGRFFTPPDVAAGMPRRELAEAAESGSARDDRHHLRKDGSTFYVRGTITAIRQGDRLLGFAKVIHDLKEEQAHAEMRQHARALIEADRMKDEFLAMLAHELRNPLAPILNAMHVLQVEPSASPAVRQAKAIVERQARQMARLIDDLLDVSRITTGKMELRKEPVEVGLVIGRAVETARPLIDSRRHRISTSVDGGPLWVEGDPTRLEQVLANLLTNAAKYSDDAGSIRVEARRDGRDAVLQVRDDGIGISAELMPRVFELFTQADCSLDRSRGGLGIGLAMVQRIVILHGGSVAARSDGPGRGSEFTIRLPLAAGGPEQHPPAIATRGDAGGGPLRVLVIDDNVDSAASLGMFLGRIYGHTVESAHDGTAGLEVAGRFRPDVVLLDIGLPGMDGFEVASRLREDAASKGAMIIAVSGYSRDQVAGKHPGESAFDHHLLKPVDPDILDHLLKEVRNPSAAGPR